MFGTAQNHKNVGRAAASILPRTARIEPRFDIFPPISNGSADLQIFRTRAKQPPTALAGNAQLDGVCDLMFVQ
jgi:hypothetical protein